ncbi:tripartite tricarboxylate transporter TctB family protein [Lutibaculum baratangense]|uniref:DUF1468 domain-containing protein n=1 Tax=Lutibaculum baratangense AMV1 TaxID=631454 RepID=V4RWL3_9HYPH|nr:tripartite tricarboxylate transporter TctB family protein [Lutibaculum baratangense]ESR27385.1 hypothetical protein N177_0079 [Lutibaculum baratangense AMV1]
MAWLREAFLPIIGIVYSILYIALTVGLPAESTIFPRTILTVLCILAVLIVLAEYRKRGGEAAKAAPPSQAPLVYGLAVVFVIGFWLFGFMAAAPVFLAAAMLLLGQPVVRALAVAVLLPAGIYLLFTWTFGVSL